AFYFFVSSRRRHTRSKRDWSSDVCSSDLLSVARQNQHQDDQTLDHEMSWADAMGLIVIEGLIILVLVLTGFRQAVFDAVPRQIKIGRASGRERESSSESDVW